MKQGTLLKLNAVTKEFPGVKALDSVDLEIRYGEVHAIVGENGAGKSTLMKIISGAYARDSGTIEFEGKELKDVNPQFTLEKGISVIYQELSYLPTMSIAENIFLARQPKTRAGVVDYKKLKKMSLEVQKKVGLGDYSPLMEVGRLTASEKQLIEIGRAQSRELKLLILDEPTSALNDEEILRLFSIIDELRSQGCGIIYITHKMDEIFKIADRVTVMRDGRHIVTRDMKAITRDEIITAMVGREITDLYPISQCPAGEKILEVENLCAGNLKNVSFYARSGEMIGFYGLMGCGCDTALECVFGKQPIKSGAIKVRGKEVRIRKPADAISQKIAYAPGERKTEGLMLIQPVRANISCVTLGAIKKGPILDLKKEKVIAKEWIDKLRIKTPSEETLAMGLSGGNQQKVVLAKWLENDPDIFLMNEPTKGIDVGAKTEIYLQMENMCKNGSAVIFVTSDLPELLAIADRVYIFHEGVISGELSGDELTQEKVAKLVIGENV